MFRRLFVVAVACLLGACTDDYLDFHIVTWNAYHWQSQADAATVGHAPLNFASWRDRIEHGVEEAIVEQGIKPDIIALQELLTWVEDDWDPDDCGGTTNGADAVQIIINTLERKFQCPRDPQDPEVKQDPECVDDKWQLMFFVQNDRGYHNECDWGQGLAIIYRSTAIQLEPFYNTLECLNKDGIPDDIPDAGYALDGIALSEGAEFCLKSSNGGKSDYIIAGGRISHLASNYKANLYVTHPWKNDESGWRNEDHEAILSKIMDVETFYYNDDPDHAFPPILMGDFNAGATDLDTGNIHGDHWQFQNEPEEELAPGTIGGPGSSTDVQDIYPDPIETGVLTGIARERSGDTLKDHIRLGKQVMTPVGGFLTESLNFAGYYDTIQYKIEWNHAWAPVPISPGYKVMHSDHPIVYKQIRVRKGNDPQCDEENLTCEVKRFLPEEPTPRPTSL